MADPPDLTLEGLIDSEMYPEVCLRGLSKMIPGLAEYIENIPRSTYVDGGYYTQTPENYPLIGPVGGEGAEGAYLCGAVAGYGVMAAHAAGELVAQRVLKDSSRPDYAEALCPTRYADPAYEAVAKKLSDPEMRGSI